MAHVVAADLVLPSLFDRLGQLGEASTLGGIPLATAIERLRVDLTTLLNTRRRLETVPRGLEQLNYSILRYGLADLTAWDIRSEEALEAVRRDVEETIRRCEPRLDDLVVVPITGRPSPDSFAVELAITATFRVEPEPVRVQFISQIQRDTKTILVERRPEDGAGGATRGAS